MNIPTSSLRLLKRENILGTILTICDVRSIPTNFKSFRTHLREHSNSQKSKHLFRFCSHSVFRYGLSNRKPISTDDPSKKGSTLPDRERPLQNPTTNLFPKAEVLDSEVPSVNPDFDTGEELMTSLSKASTLLSE